MSDLTPYHAKYFAHELTKRSGSDSVEKFATALADAQVDLNPHQIDAALFAFRSPFSKGAILADEVGLGKTIEAGILLAQKWAERKRRLLVICPSNLRKQWSQEMADKFFLPSAILETKTFNDAVRAGNLNPFSQPAVVICSYQFARTKEPYIRQTEWNLVVIDEAHRLRNVYKPTSKIANAIKTAVSAFPKVLLTATPLQNSLLELYGLVSIVDEMTFGDLKSFRSQFSRLSDDNDFAVLKERLRPVCKRTLRRQVLEYVNFTSRHALVQEFVASGEEQRLYGVVSDYLRRPTLYALPASQRQLMTLILRKLLASSTYAITETLEGLAKKLEKAASVAAPVESVPDGLSENFEELPEIEDEWAEEQDGDEAVERPSFTPEQLEELKQEIEMLRQFHALAKSIVKNSKGEVLLTALRRGFAAAAEARKGKRSAVLQQKAIIFTESRRTQDYLYRVLERTEFAGKIVLFNGSNTDAQSTAIYRRWMAQHAGTDRITNSPTADRRAALVEYFRDEAAIMIATEAAAEGINLQFCNLVVNYDLPWNPQRVEQRIGRCHRYGQKFDVVVVNFLNKDNAADVRVYQLLDEKFQLFNGVFGASDEVLGSVESGVDFEKRIVGIYQKCRTPEQIAFEFDELQKDLETEIGEGQKEARDKLLNNFDHEVVEKVRIQSHKVLSRFNEQLWLLTRFILADEASFDDNQYNFTLHKNPFPNEQINPGPYRLGREVADANLYRVGHPIARKVIEKAVALDTPAVHVDFDYAGSGKNIAILQPLLAHSGYLVLAKLTLEALEQAEDHLVFAACTDAGEILDDEQSRRLFLLPATVGAAVADGQVPESLSGNLTRACDVLMATLADRNSSFFDSERRKLDAWADDQISNAEKALRDTKLRIRDLRNESGKAASLAEQVRLQEEIAASEKKLRKFRQEIFDVEDEIGAKRDRLVGDLRSKLGQTEAIEILFKIRWSLGAFKLRP
jgi:superfamily II DNA or RNA helicase